jgi:hypothetical protein
MKVPGKKCSQSVTRHWKSHRKRGLEKLLEFLMAYSKPSRAERKHYELVTGCKAPKPLTEKEREAWAKKAFAQITGRGLGELEMITITSLLEDWVANEKSNQKKRAWEKALSVIEKNRKEAKRTETDRFIKSFGSSSYSQYRGKS